MSIPENAYISMKVRKCVLLKTEECEGIWIYAIFSFATMEHNFYKNTFYWNFCALAEVLAASALISQGWIYSLVATGKLEKS